MGVSFKGYEAVARLLIAHGTNLDLQNSNGGTALMFATLFGRNNLVKLLAEAGANTSIADARGLTALHLAGQQGSKEAWKLLGGTPEQQPAAAGTNSACPGLLKQHLCGAHPAGMHQTYVAARRKCTAVDRRLNHALRDANRLGSNQVNLYLQREHILTVGWLRIGFGPFA